MNQHHKLEQLCRYITRPAIANERLKINSNGDVVLQLKSPYKDGTTHLVLSPFEFMQRLAAFVPRPRLNLIRCHGVLAPNARLRSAIIPKASQNANDIPVDSEGASHHINTARLSWARLLQREFNIDMQTCPHWWLLEDHRRDSKPIGHYQDSRLSRFTHPRVAHSPGTVCRSFRNNLIPHQHSPKPGPSPQLAIPHARHSIEASIAAIFQGFQTASDNDGPGARRQTALRVQYVDLAKFHRRQFGQWRT